MYSKGTELALKTPRFSHKRELVGSTPTTRTGETIIMEEYSLDIKDSNIEEAVTNERFSDRVRECAVCGEVFVSFFNRETCSDKCKEIFKDHNMGIYTSLNKTRNSLKRLDSRIYDRIKRK